jgi:hypothetical protein
MSTHRTKSPVTGECGGVSRRGLLLVAAAVGSLVSVQS